MNSRGSKKNKKKNTQGQGVRFPHFQTYDWATLYHFYLKIYLETGAPPLAELPSRSTQFPLCNIWFTWTIISACRMTCSSKRSVMWLCQMRVVRKAERSFFLKYGHTGEDALRPKCSCRSLSVKQDFLFPALQHSSLFPLNMASFIPSESKGISFDGTMMWVLYTFLESVWPLHHWAELSRPATGAEAPAGPRSGSGSRTVLHHSGSGAVTHPLSAIWDGVEVGVNCGSAMEKLVLLSVSENEG